MFPASSTFSLAGRCPRTGELGAIITSSSPAVGARCVRGKAGIGMILTQNVTDPRLPGVGLAALEMGYGARGALEAMKSASEFAAYRQLAVVDATGGSAVFSGEGVLQAFGEYAAENVVSIGNLLSDPSIPRAMAEEFSAHPEQPLAERLLSAMSTGFRLGGELDQEHSIALVVFRDLPFPYVDLRIDYTEDPLSDMWTLWKLYAPQADAYVTRALAPAEAPSFGVRGDE
ncbi:MAG: DUF1028 domain-containing protein [Alicyclobacillus sp.]|nr:DUF1028 domain-containing protein [Alicyclobacillus sp.]